MSINKKLILISLLILTGCSISFVNISTHGTANDLVDEQLKANADIKPELAIPALPL